MRGGAIPIFAWGLLNLILFIANTVWNGKLMDSLASGFAALAIFLLGVAVMIGTGRVALRKGPPEPTRRVEPVAGASLGAVVAGLSVACLLYGFVFGSFLVFFGAGMLVLSLGRVIFEVRSERQSVRELTEREMRVPR